MRQETKGKVIDAILVFDIVLLLMYLEAGTYHQANSEYLSRQRVIDMDRIVPSNLTEAKLLYNESLYPVHWLSMLLCLVSAVAFALIAKWGKI